METHPRPKLGWIYQKSCFNEIKESNEMDSGRINGISPSERLGSMFDSGLYSDCSFLVEEQEMRAHKLILAASSPKMEQMFLDPEVTKTELVEVPYSFRVMQLILKHVYLQDMNIENIEEAQDVIEAASFFQMTDLVELCCAGIEPESLDDLWPALNLACLYNSRALKEACLCFASEHSEDLVSQEGLQQLSPEALIFLLSRDIIKVNSELQIIEMVINWAENHLQNDLDIRQQLEKHGILSHLRILSLSEADFDLFITDLGTKIFSETELNKLEYNYFSDTCENFVSPLRFERMLEHRVPICGTDYLAVSSDNDNFSVNVKVYETVDNVRPVIKMIVLPSQINPANILYDNVSHKTHYNECVLVEISCNNKVIGRGSYCDRIKYGDDVYISVNTFNIAPIYSSSEEKCYNATVKIIFKNHGYYPLAVDMKNENDMLVLEESCRFIHEFILICPQTQ